jgi:uncharacterized membrane protein
MRLAFILILVLFSSACMQTENSNSQDATTWGTGGARAVIAASCGNCHNYHTLSDSELTAQNLVTAGDPENSKLYYRITGSDGALGPKNMPQGGSISQGDRDAIKAWIQNL